MITTIRHAMTNSEEADDTTKKKDRDNKHSGKLF
jgi:hypothetical protein